MKKNIEEPIEYVRGFTYFLGCKIDLSKKPLIPRPETEFWVRFAIKTILGFCRTQEWCKKENIKVLDVFSGSGCVGLAVLKNIKNTEVVFADKDKRCIEQIKINLKINKVKGIVRQSDIFSNIKNKYDFILANPPYVARKKIKQVQKSVLKYEPTAALFGGDDGLFYINKFLKDAKKFLKPSGRVYMEFSPEQKNKIEKLLKSLARQNARSAFVGWKFHRDQFNRWRWVVIQ